MLFHSAFYLRYLCYLLFNFFFPHRRTLKTVRLNAPALVRWLESSFRRGPSQKRTGMCSGCRISLPTPFPRRTRPSPMTNLPKCGSPTTPCTSLSPFDSPFDSPELAIPWQVARQQCLPPFHQASTSLLNFCAGVAATASVLIYSCPAIPQKTLLRQLVVSLLTLSEFPASGVLSSHLQAIPNRINRGIGSKPVLKHLFGDHALSTFHCVDY